jgi:hypothetical protein
MEPVTGQYQMLPLGGAREDPVPSSGQFSSDTQYRLTNVDGPFSAALGRIQEWEDARAYAVRACTAVLSKSMSLRAFLELVAQYCGEKDSPLIGEGPGPAVFLDMGASIIAAGNGPRFLRHAHAADLPIQTNGFAVEQLWASAPGCQVFDTHDYRLSALSALYVSGASVATFNEACRRERVDPSTLDAPANGGPKCATHWAHSGGRGGPLCIEKYIERCGEERDLEMCACLLSSSGLGGWPSVKKWLDKEVAYVDHVNRRCAGREHL